MSLTIPLFMNAAAGRPDPLAALARSAARNNAAAIRSLLCELGPSVFAIVEAVLGRSSPDVDDVAQEAFIAVLRALETFRYESTVAHFAKRITLRRASVALRHQRAARRATSATVHLDAESGEPLESNDASPFESTVSARQMSLLREIVTELPEEQAECLLLRAVLGFAVEEIADAVHAPSNTVRSRLRAARAALRERIAADARLAELAREPNEPEEDA